MPTAVEPQLESLRALPGDDIRQIQWRFADRCDLQMLVQSARAVARGPSPGWSLKAPAIRHDWTPAKQTLLQHFDDSGITGVFLDPDQGGLVEGPKNLALALVAFELAWVDAGAATGSLAGCLALSPIHERGTPEQRDTYLRLCAPAQPGEDRKPWRGAFCLTEPIPYVGVETGILAGKAPHRRVGRRPGAGASGGKARPFHHQHGIRQFRHRRRGYRRPAHSRAVHGDPA